MIMSIFMVKMIMMMLVIREAPPKKKRENVGIFPKWGAPPPSPLFGNDTFVKKNYGLFCISGP